MAKIERRWIDDQAIDESKIDPSIAGPGLSGGAGLPLSIQYGTGLLVTSGGTLAVDIENVGGNLDNLTIGTSKSEDGGDDDFSDGLFPWEQTKVASVALDEINEVLKALAPPLPPQATAVDSSTSNILSGKLSFGTSNTIAGYTNVVGSDVGDTFSRIVDGSNDITGTINHNVASEVGGAYAANAFQSGDKGDLILKLNGVTLYTLDLTTAGAGNFLTSGSGFENVSVATPVNAPSGTIDLFKYRTADFRIAASALQDGYNVITIEHSEGGVVSNEETFVVDSDSTNTTFSGQSFGALTMTGSKYISGINYHTGGSVLYDITISNAYRNTYNTSGSAINHNISTNLSISNQSLPTPTTEADDIVLSDVVATIDSTRVIETSNALALRTRVSRVHESATNSSTLQGFSILMDNAGDGSTEDDTETFNAETYRVVSDADFETDTNFTGGGSKIWDSNESIGNGGNAGFNDGLQVFNGSLVYPNIDFNSYTDGQSTENYSTASGDRVYYRYFRNTSPGSGANFRFNMSVTNTNFVTVATGASGNNLTCEIKAPGETDGQTSGWKDCSEQFLNNSQVGSYSATNGSTIPTNWGITIGTRNIANSNFILVMKITASASWTGSIDNIALTYL